MKKFFLVAVAALSLSLVACGGKKNEDANEKVDLQSVVKDANKTTEEKTIVICDETTKLLKGAKSAEEVEEILNTTGDAIQALQELDPKYVPSAEAQKALMNLMTACSEAENKFEASDEVIDDFGDFDEDEEEDDFDEE